jgi:RNA polymerase sigma-70 factor (ECF subfamily)
LAIDAGSLEFAADEALVVAFQDGEADAFSRIVEAYYGVLIGRARRLMRSDEDAQDVVQETLLRAYRGLPNFGGEYRLAAWLNRILGNVAADAKRRQGLEIRLHTRLAGVRNVDAAPEERIADADADRRAVTNAVASLSDLQREAFVLRTVGDQSYAEIAQILSISEVNARARVHRARAHLQESLRGMKAPAVVLVAWRGHLSRILGRKFAKPALEKRAALPVPSPAPKGFSLTQLISQSMASPTGQAASTIASEAGRWMAPGTGAFTGLLASAAVVVVAPASMLLAPLVAPSQAAPAPHVVAAAPAVTVADDQPLVGPSTVTAAPPATVTAAPETEAPQVSTETVPLTPAPTAPTTDPGTPASTSAANTTATTTPAATSQPWSWTNGAATATGSNAPATGVALPACPYLGSANAASVPSETSGGNATNYLSSETVAVPASATSFESSGLGTLSGGSGISTVNVSFGACSPSTSDPALLATITSASAPGQLQLNGSLVSSSTGDGETDSYYRGLAAWLDAADQGSPPVEFVADLVTMTDNTAVLHVAFLGSVAGPLSPPVATPAATASAPASDATGATSGAGTSAGTGTTDPSATPPASPGSTSTTSTSTAGSSTSSQSNSQESTSTGTAPASTPPSTTNSQESGSSGTAPNATSCTTSTAPSPSPSPQPQPQPPSSPGANGTNACAGTGSDPTSSTVADAAQA